MARTTRQTPIGKGRWCRGCLRALGFKRDLHTSMRARDHRLAVDVLRGAIDPDAARWSTSRERDVWSYD